MSASEIADEESSIYDVHRRCLESFESCRRHPQLSDLTVVEDELGRFKRYNDLQKAARIFNEPEVVLHQTELPSNLDFRSIGVHLHRKPDSVDKQQGDVEDDPEKTYTALERATILSIEALQTVHNTITQLQRLSTAIRRASAREYNMQAARDRDSKDGVDEGADDELCLKKIVRFRYPAIDPLLQDTLGNAMSFRTRRLKYRKQIHVRQDKTMEREGEVKWSLPSNSTILPRPSSPNQKRDVMTPKQSIDQLPNPTSESSKHSISISEAPTFSSELFDPPKSQSSSVRSSDTTFSVVDDVRINWPSIPKSRGKNNKECPYCFDALEAEETRDKRKWRLVPICALCYWLIVVTHRKHVKRDLEPYNCFFPECQIRLKMFSTESQWANHVRTQHARGHWVCRMRPHDNLIFQEEEHFRAHVQEAHPGLFPKSQLAVLGRRSYRNSPAFDMCPLGCPRETISTAREAGQQQVDPVMRHIANHLLSLALESLPPRDDLTGSNYDNRLSEEAEKWSWESKRPDSAESMLSEVSITGSCDATMETHDWDEIDPCYHDAVGARTLQRDDEWGFSKFTRFPPYCGTSEDPKLAAFWERALMHQRRAVIPYPRNPGFVNRPELMNLIGQNCALPESWTALVGLGGIGKSQLALEYAYQIREQRPDTWVFWINASNTVQLEQGCRDIVEKVGALEPGNPSSNVFKVLHKWLHNNRDGKWLLVLDDVDDVDFLFTKQRHIRDAKSANYPPLGAFVSDSKNGSILITSRNLIGAQKLLELNSLRHVIMLPLMDQTGALALLKNILAEKYNDRDLVELAAILGFLPLAMAQVAAYLNERWPGIPIRQCIEDLRVSDSAKMNLLLGKMNDMRQDQEANHPILSTFFTSFNYLREERASAADLLSIVSFFQPDEIPQVLIQTWINMRDYKQDQEGKPLNDVDYSTDSKARPMPSDNFEEDILTLQEHAVLFTNTDRGTFFVHRLVQLAVRKWLETNGQQEIWKQRSVKVLCAAFPPAEYENWSDCRALWPHVQLAMAQRPERDDLLAEWASLFQRAANYAWTQRCVGDLEQILMEALNIKRALGAEHPVTLGILEIVGFLSNFEGRLNDAAKYLDELDSIEDEVLQETCLKDLDETDARARLENVETPFEDTYSWLFQNRVGFEDWLSGKLRSSIYWIQGKPGSGKSTAMKYAMQNKKTRHFLARYHQNDWIVAGFFFHDRGSIAQKSLSSMLREVLFEILRRRCHLIRPLLKLHPSVVRISGSGDEKSIIINWTQQVIERALSSLTSLKQLNLCLFVDALDEHEGNHRTLLAAVNKLQELCDHRQFCLRLCLSSRPEDVFQQVFQTCPGFVIHEWTKQDILKYTLKRLADIEMDAAIRFHDLVEEISQKACGVFLWVKLVVDELLEGWENGDNIGELISTLSFMPPELEGLYERTLRRSVRSGIEVGRKYKRDAFIMFQIALCTETPLGLDVFLSITNHCSSGASQDDNSTFNQKRRRLHSRCFGLLEVVPAIGHDIGRSDIEDVNEVQFIHQTAKSFFITKKGFDILLADLDDIPDGNGHTYILQHSVSTIIGGAPSGKFLIHSHNAEMTTRRPSIPYIIRELQGREEPLQSLISRLLRAEEVAPKLLETLTNVGNNDLSLLVISACACLPLSAAESLKSLGHMRRRYAGISLRATISDTVYNGISNFDATQEILKSMLETGMDADSIFTDGETPFATLIRVSNPLYYDDVFSETEQRTRLLSTLVHYGADPNQMIALYGNDGIFAPGLHHVLHGSSPQNLLSALLSFGADVSLPDSEGFLALFYAIAWNKRECVRILLWNHARVCHLNAVGLCALAPAPEDFGLSSFYKEFEDFESRCLLFNDLFLEAGVNHVETCKYFRGERGEVT
ncbi:MAG: hypothetical protein M1820_009523 [Bogoriella megaspora]|nr:MAG: hypothetical protein M1820_009523 [Bogoriella megaspora]